MILPVAATAVAVMEGFALTARSVAISFSESRGLTFADLLYFDFPLLAEAIAATVAVFFVFPFGA